MNTNQVSIQFPHKIFDFGLFSAYEYFYLYSKFHYSIILIIHSADNDGNSSGYMSNDKRSMQTQGNVVVE